jgi:hypothetical protein
VYFCGKTSTLPEVKWNAINMKLAGHSKHEIMKVLGIRNDTQIEDGLVGIEMVKPIAFTNL